MRPQLLAIGAVICLLAVAAPATARHDADPVNDATEGLVCGRPLVAELVNALPSDVAACNGADDVESALFEGAYRACPAGLCIRVVPTTKVDDLLEPNASAQVAPLAAVQIDRGTLTVHGAGEHATVPVALARVNGAPGPAALDQEVGPVRTDYEPLESCVGGTCRLVLGADADVGTDKIGELWRARLQVVLEGDTQPSVDVPLLTAVWTR